MGLLDDVLGNVVGAALGGGAQQQAQNPLGSLLNSLGGGNQAQGGSLLAMAMSLLQQNGGLEGVLNMFRQQGMAKQADSWVGTGANVGISPDQLQQVFGSQAVGAVASQLGLSTGQAGSALAQLLPELINQLTPQGRVPDEHDDVISQALGMLRGVGR